MPQKKEIYSVSILSKEIKALLEKRYPYIWIYGEISNLRVPSSGHCYFTLKDSASQINAVIFRGQVSRLKFRLYDGLTITGLCRLSLYEPRGTYQLIFEFMEPQGTGALQLAFEQLKQKLSEEGLFAEKAKKNLPTLPRRIALVTSPTGAVVHDMMTTFARRFPVAELLVVPVSVQGELASAELAEAISTLNRHKAVDLIIIARGGGSLEDLAPFNSELLARSIFASTIPIVSAVGHETDYTISDFTADLRAPTPTAAATLSVPDQSQLRHDLSVIQARMQFALKQQIEGAQLRLQRAFDRLVDPRKKIYDHRLRLDELTQRMNRSIMGAIDTRRDAAQWRRDRLKAASPMSRVELERHTCQGLATRLTLALHTTLFKLRGKLQGLDQSLRALSPEGVLERGYSIIRRTTDGELITRASQVQHSDALDIVLADGVVETLVQRKKDGKKTI